MFAPVRIGLIGFGNFGRLHALTLMTLSEAKLVAIVDSNPNAIVAAQQQIADVPVWENLDRALAECDAEAWIIASSTQFHVPLAKRLLSSGRSVLIEKPLAQSLDVATDLESLIRPDSSNLMMGHILLFNSEFQQLRDEAQQRGSLIYIDCVRHRPTDTVQRFPNETPFHLTMVHDLYSVSALMNGADPRSFTAQLHRTAHGACDLALAQLKWDNGTVASLAASFLTPAGMPADGFDRLEVFGQGWAARIEPNPRPFELWDQHAHWPMNLEIRTSPNGSSGMLAEELRCFCRVVRGQQKVPIGARYLDALQILRWLEHLEAAAQYPGEQSPC